MGKCRAIRPKSGWLIVLGVVLVVEGKGEGDGEGNERVE